jgi:hypothetical protein
MATQAENLHLQWQIWGADLSQIRSLADLGQTRIALTGNAILHWPSIKGI